MYTYFFKYKTLIIALLISMSTFSCKHAPTDFDDAFYEYDPSSTTIEWTAYKYTTKAGVTGTFKEIGVSGTKIGTHPMEVFEELNFNIETKSVDSNSAFRDNNIISYFFNKMVSSDFIIGKTTRYSGDHSSGILYIDLSMNGIQKEVPFNYTVQGMELSVTTDINLADWNADTTLDFFKACCTDYHTGTDGVHLLWPDVKIEIKTFLEKRSI